LVPPGIYRRHQVQSCELVAIVATVMSSSLLNGTLMNGEEDLSEPPGDEPASLATSTDTDGGDGDAIGSRWIAAVEPAQPQLLFMPGMKPPDPAYCFNLVPSWASSFLNHHHPLPLPHHHHHHHHHHHLHQQQQFYPQQTAKCIDVAYGCDGGMVAPATGPLPFASAVDVNHHVVPALADEELLLTAAPLTAAAPAPAMGLSIAEQQQHHHHPSQVAGSYFSCSNQSSSPVMIDSSIPAPPDFDSYVLLNDTGANGNNVDLVPNNLPSSINTNDSNDNADDENGINGNEFPCSPVSGSTITTTDDSGNQRCNDTVDTVDSGVAACSLSTSQNSSKTDDTSEQLTNCLTDDPAAADSQFTDYEPLPQQQQQQQQQRLSDEREEENGGVVISSEEMKNNSKHGDEPLQSSTVSLSACADEGIAVPTSTLTATTASPVATDVVKNKTPDNGDGASICSSSRSSVNDATTTTVSNNDDMSNSNNNGTKASVAAVTSTTALLNKSFTPVGPNPIYVHVNPGQTLSLRLGNEVQHIPGPATVRMVSDQNPPLPLPMNVPPGHLVQQIVDENGALRHVILSPQNPHPPMPAGHPYPCLGAASSRHVVSGPPASGGMQYIPFGANGTGSTVRLPAGPVRMDGNSAASSAAFYPIHGDIYPACSLSTMPGDKLYRHGSAERGSKNRMHHRMDRRRYNQPFHSAQYHDFYPGYRHEEPEYYFLEPIEDPTVCMEDEEMTKIVEMLSKIQPPEVCEVGVREALVRWQCLDCSEAAASGGPFPQIDASEFTFEVLLWEKRHDGKCSWTSRCCGGQTEQWLFGLKPGTEYFLRLKAILEERGLHGEMTEPISFRTKPTHPEKPLPPRVLHRARTAITLRWTSPIDNGSKITSYHLEMDDGDGQFQEVYTGPAKQARIGRLNPSSGYSFRLAAANYHGISDYSDLCTTTTCGIPPAKPDPPALLEATKSSLKLTWAKKDTDQIELYVTDAETDAGFQRVWTTSDSRYTLTNLKRSTEYRLRICVLNEDGQSPLSNEVVYSTLPVRPLRLQAPTLLGMPSTSEARVTWQLPEGELGAVEYTVEWRRCGQLETDKAQKQHHQQQQWYVAYTGPERQCLLTNLQPGLTYSCRVKYISKTGDSSLFSDELLFNTLPVAPGQMRAPFVVGKPKATSIHLKWSAACNVADKTNTNSNGADGSSSSSSSSSGGGCVVDYELELVLNKPNDHEQQKQQQQQDVEAVQPKLIYVGAKTEYTVQALSPGRHYQLRVRACNSAGHGPWSDALICQTALASPEPPQQLRLERCTSDSVSLAWQAPNSNNGSPVIQYRLHCARQSSLSGEMPVAASASSSSKQVNSRRRSSESTRSWLSSSSHDEDGRRVRTCSDETSSEFTAFQSISCGNVLNYEVRSLEADTEYSFCVQAVNAVGASAPSAQVLIRTKPGPPDYPSNVTAEALSVSEIAITWEMPNCHGRPVLGFNLEIAPAPSGLMIPVLLPADSFYHTVGSLLPETAYRVRVQAFNECGPSSYSPAVRVVTLSPPPLPPYVELASATYNQLKLRWTDRRSGTSDLVNLANDTVVYNLEIENKNGTFSPVYEGSSANCKVTRLTECTVYKFRARSVSRVGGAGPWSEPFHFKTLRMAPPPFKNQVRVTEVGETGATVDWPACRPNFADGDKLAYQVSLNPVARLPAVPEVKVVYPFPTNSHKFSNLIPGTQYQVKIIPIRICNVDGVEVPGPAASVTFTTLAVPVKKRVVQTTETVVESARARTVFGQFSAKLTDAQCAFVILFAFTALTIALACGIERFIKS
ncbi:Fibronectin type III domain-containing protein 3B, partial [Trichinella zimbabwensis]